MVDMSLIAILGPMKSGKSLELIARVAPHEIAGKKIFSGQSLLHVRDQGIHSRAGVQRAAKPLKRIDIDEISGHDVVAIDEIHMFTPEDIRLLASMRETMTIIVSGLDLDYRGKLIPTIKALYELKPDEIVYKNAVCENCNALDAGYTQIFTKDGNAVTDGLAAVVPEDGTYLYKAICHRCFKQIIV